MSEPTASAKLGTFYGVFTPSILTILGVVLFLRTGWVVANVGLVPALSIIVVAHLITFATAFSVAAIATNMHVGAGGAYYMISRSLGLEIGGAIGVPLFLAQTFSVTLYAFGFAESVQLFWPEAPMRLIAALTVLAVALLAGRSTELALKLQLPIMIAIGLALVSLFAGSASRASDTLGLWQGVANGEGYWQVFAVFFPAVTGLMAGVSLSGDLENPKRSITRGTLWAVFGGFVVYLIVPIALAASASPAELVSDNLVWFKIAAVPMLILPGLLGAIFSSAVGSILGAPRTLEALIHDRILPRFPDRWIGKDTARSLPHFLSTGVALAAVGLGNLNAVAPVLTMFFLTTYGMVNLVAGLEELSGAPSYRPSIKVPWYISVLGGVGCIWVMWLINQWAAIIAITLEVLLYVGLRRRSLAASWGDLRYGALMSLTRASLLKLRELPVDPRNWRPHILVFVGESTKRLDLIRIAAWLNQQRGILTVSHLLIGDLQDLALRLPGEVQRTNKMLEEEGVLAFAEAEVAPDLESGVLAVCQANGIAGITSNTIMLGWSEDHALLASLLRVADRAALLSKSTVICRIAPRRWAARFQEIVVWWGGRESNGDMLLLFAYLVSVNPAWSDARIVVKTVASNEMSSEKTERRLRELLERCRIKADTRVIPLPDGTTVRDLILQESAAADLVFMGLKNHKPGEEEEYGERLRELVGDLPTVVLVRAAGPFAGRLLTVGDAPETETGLRAAAVTTADEDL